MIGSSRFKRGLAAVLALALGLNGAVMLAAGRWWYGAVPGVTMTGPFNPHFVMDIGAAYLIVGGALAWLAWRASTQARGAVIAAAGFLGVHAAIHLAGYLGDAAGLAHFGRDFPGVFLPALIAGWLAWPNQPQPETRHA
jgi:hypothetical protein